MIASNGASRRVATGAITLGDVGRSPACVEAVCFMDTSLNPVPCAVIRPDGLCDVTPWSPVSLHAVTLRPRQVA
jgi:hypothetical protein